jgi:hypothetical protein
MMQLMVQLSKNSRFWLVLFFSLYFILGLLCFRDYGILGMNDPRN